MEFLDVIKNGDPTAFLSTISRIHHRQEEHFQEILRDTRLRFEEWRDFEVLTETNDVKKAVKEPKRKRPAGTDVSKLFRNDSVCTTDMKEPLGSSTPTEASSIVSENKENRAEKLTVISQTSVPAPSTPPNESKCPMKSESVKKRIEEFEKRAAVAALSSASKIPVLTPVKKNFKVPTINKNSTTKPTKEEYGKSQIYTEKPKKEIAKTQIYVEKTKEVPVLKPRLTRNNSKILQEKNTNVKTLKEKAPDPPIKKTLTKKASTDESRRTFYEGPMVPSNLHFSCRGCTISKIIRGNPISVRKKEEMSQKTVQAKVVIEKPKRDTALRELQEKEKEAKIRAIHKQKEEKLLLLKKKQQETMKFAETKTKEVEKKTDECYDIEDVVDGTTTDDEENPTKKIPSWATKENRKRQLCTQAWIDKKTTVYLWFYNRNLRYPNVEELFSVGVKTRPRTSSAVWNNSSICL